jgi:uridine kinase
MKTIKIKFNGKDASLPAGTKVSAILNKYIPEENGLPWLGAIVNNRVVDMDYALGYDSTIVPLNYRTAHGREIYFNSATLMFYEAVRRLFRDAKVVIGQSLASGYYFDILKDPIISSEEVKAICSEMKNIAEQNLPFIRKRLAVEDAIEQFKAWGRLNKVHLLRTMVKVPDVYIVTCGEFQDILFGHTATTTGVIKGYELVKYDDGIILRFPDPKNPSLGTPPFFKQPKLFKSYKETRNWNTILGVRTLADLNEACISGDIKTIIKVAEGFHEKRISDIADEISKKKDTVRLVLISGPSASGKSTFIKRLSVQLRVNGIKPVELSLDDYYLDRENTPRDEKGDYDFECLEALDLPLLNDHLKSLLKGKEIQRPKFNFNAGKRSEAFVPMKLKEGEILLIEGIHGLNERLTEQVPVENKLKIYISSLTQLSIDDHNRIHTADARLVRRLVRDRLFRGYKASDTIKLWPNVRRGEEKFIFPFQEDADIIFNSALVYELSVLRVFAERFLLEVSPDDEAFVEASKLFGFLTLFVPIFPDDVPHNSILREFLGGSSFKYS